MRLLSGNIYKDIRDQIVKSAKADFAVAYWGVNAIQILGLEDRKEPIRIICDAYSGACNPGELLKLLKIGAIIHEMPRLHSKVYIFDKAIVVGSANASTNGLGEDGDIKNEESALLSRDSKIVKEASDWFEMLWNATLEVDHDNLSKLKSTWRPRPKSENRSLSKTIFSLMKSRPSWFKGKRIRLLAYEGEEPSSKIKKSFAQRKDRIYTTKQLQKFERSGDPYYVDKTNWEIRGGDFILDFNIDRDKKRAEFSGIWRVKDKVQFYYVGKSRVILCDLYNHYFGRNFQEQEIKKLCNLVYEEAERRSFKGDRNKNILDLPLDEAAALLLGLDEE